MNRKFKLATLLPFVLTLTLFLATLPMPQVSAAPIQEKQSTHNVIIDGNHVQYQETVAGNQFDLEVNGENGSIHLTRIEDKIVKLESDFLDASELDQMKKDINSSISKQEKDSDITIDTLAQTGSWSYGNWQYRTVTAKGKVNAEIVLAALGGTLGPWGSLAGGLAALMVENKVQTGYFSIRHELRNDTSLGYYWERIRVHVYKDSSRKTLIGQKLSNAIRYAPPTY